MANPPAGWHPDPLTRHAQRYWDGNQWTEHVADQAGNMSTDPLDGGTSSQQATQTTQTDDDDTGGWGQSTGTSSQDSAWGTSDSSAGRTDDAPAWARPDDATDDPATDDTPDWGSTDTSDGEPDATDEPAWGSGAGAAGAAAAAGGVAASEHGEPDPATDTDVESDSWTDSAADSGADSDADSGADHTPAISNATVTHPTIAEVAVGDGVVVRHGRVVATSGDVTLGDSPHPGSLSATGSGTLYVGAGGRQITILDVPAAGLTIHDEALVAHSGGLERAAAADGIVGYDATAVTGGGWVAIAAVGGALEVSPAGGVDVAVASLVAWSSDLDVSHAEHVNLHGRGTVLVSAGD